MLTDSAVKNAQPAEKSYKLADALLVRFSKDFTKYIRVVMLPCGI